MQKQNKKYVNKLIMIYSKLKRDNYNTKLLIN